MIGVLLLMVVVGMVLISQHGEFCRVADDLSVQRKGRK